MARKREKIVIGGAGAGGISVGWGLIKAGYDVTVLEKCESFCQMQSGPRGGQGRRHGGAFYAGITQVAQGIRKEADSLNEIPGTVVRCGALYFVKGSVLPLVISGWQEAQIPFHEDKMYNSLLKPSFLQSHQVRTYITNDQLIDSNQLASYLKSKFEELGGRLELVTSVTGSIRKNGKIVAIRTKSGDKEKDFECDLWINVTGAWQQKVEKVVNPDAVDELSKYFELKATPVWRPNWNWPSAPMILQFYGNFEPENARLQNQLSVIPISGGNTAAISTVTAIDVKDPDDFYDPSRPNYKTNQNRLEQEPKILWALLSEALEGFDWWGGNDLGTTAWCVKSFLTHPEVRRRGIQWGALLVTVIPTQQYFGGVKNAIIGSPGKLGSVLIFRNQVVEEVKRYFNTYANVKRTYMSKNKLNPKR